MPFHISDPFSPFWQWLQNAESVFAFATLLSGWIAWRRMRAFFYRRRYQSVGNSSDSRRRFRGIIFLISQQNEPIWVIENHQVEKIGLVYTEQSAKAATAVMDVAKANNIPVLHPDQLTDPEAVDECLRIVRSQLDALGAGADPSGFAVDVTGGKKTMSLGAFMAANELGVEAVYTSHRRSGSKAIPERLITVSGH